MLRETEGTYAARFRAETLSASAPDGLDFNDS